MVAYQISGKHIIKDPTLCPHCFKITEGIDAIIHYFGLRMMGDGTTRVQSWCKECRSESREVMEQ